MNVKKVILLAVPGAILITALLAPPAFALTPAVAADDIARFAISAVAFLILGLFIYFLARPRKSLQMYFRPIEFILKNIRIFTVVVAIIALIILTVVLVTLFKGTADSEEQPGVDISHETIMRWAHDTTLRDLESSIGKVSQWMGIADNAPTGAVISVDGNTIFVNNLKSWPDDLLGKKVIATGKLLFKEHVLGFAGDERIEFDVFLLEDATWKLADDPTITEKPVTPDAKTGLPKLPETQEACLEAGGVWGRMTPIHQKEYCNMQTSDAGKTCTDSSQCQGPCIGEYQGINLTSGKCSEWRIASGCHAFFHNGKPGSVCID
ncbi:MAG: hypothetical protein Q7S09_05940 [bacterium]|nr:hypothetical protein [bacterium]